MSNYERVPLKKGDELQLRMRDSWGVEYSQKAIVEEFIGKGASCLTYVVDLYKDSTNYARMIMKEFYPQMNGIEICREEKELHITVGKGSMGEYFNERSRFQNSYTMQNELSGSDAMEIMVKPYQLAEYGESLYLLSDMHMGKVLSASEIKDFSQKIWLIYRVAEAMQLLHEQGYLYMDLNPKNILWIESQQIVKLFDVDSIIPYKKLDDVHEIRVTRPYVAPEIERLEKWFEIKKRDFLTPAWDVYCLGLLLFELVFGRFPTEKDLETGYGKEGELEKICSDNGYDEITCSLLQEILEHSLNKKFRKRYKSAQEMCEAVNQLKKRVDARAFISKKEFVKANATMKAYYMLDRWPIYKYGKKIEDHQQILDIAIVGAHTMREEFVKAIYSCTHMLDTTIRLRMYASDAKEFWSKLEEKNPLLKKTVKLFVNGTCIREEYEERVCSRPIAEIYLYDKKDVAEIESDYILLLEEKNECSNSVRKIKENLQGEQKKLVAYLDDGSHYLEEEVLQLVPISMIDKCSYYDEKLLETELLQRALHVHAMYYKGNHKRAAWEEIKADFESNIYNIESSMRSALTVKYKLASIGMNPESREIASEFYEKVLSKEAEARKAFDELSALEHLSWSAYMIINGWDVPEEGQIEEYAFVGKNDFKDKQNHLHTCLVESRPGSVLADWSHKDWEEALENAEKMEALDGLDRMSVVLHAIAKKKVPKAIKRVNNLMESLGELVLRYRLAEMQNAYQWLGLIKERIFAGENTAEALWKQARFNFQNVLQMYEVKNPQFEELLDRVDSEMRVIHEYNAFHDYKKSDEDIICGIPYILCGDKVKRVVKPYVAGKKNRWKNMLITLYLEPEELVLLSEERVSEEAEFYQKFLKDRGIQTKVTVKDFERGRKEEQSTVWDVTGLSEKQINEYESGILVGLNEGEITGLANYVKGQFSRNTHLTVEETFDLFGENIYLNEREQTALALGECYQKIWGAYQEVTPVLWNKTVDKLVQLEKAKEYVLPIEKTDEVQTYWTEPVNGKAIYYAEIPRLLKRCKKEGLIEEYYFPGEEDELSVWVKTSVKGLFEVLEQFIMQANEEPLRHQFQLEKGTGRNFVVKDKSLYVSCDEMDAEIESTLRILEKMGKDPMKQQTILQNLKIKDGKCSFKYASEAVRKCLQSYDMILDVVLYYACLNTGLFDDVDIGTRFMEAAEDASGIWGSGNAKIFLVTGSVERIEDAYKIVMQCENDYFKLSGDSEKQVFYHDIDVKEETLKKQIFTFFQKNKDEE